MEPNPKMGLRIIRGRAIAAGVGGKGGGESGTMAPKGKHVAAAESTMGR